MILTKEEAAGILKLENATDYQSLNIILPAIDDYIKTATGKDWSTDDKIDPTAKMVASILLVRWFEDTGMIGKVEDKGLIGLVIQLKCKI